MVILLYISRGLQSLAVLWPVDAVTGGIPNNVATHTPVNPAPQREMSDLSVSQGYLYATIIEGILYGAFVRLHRRGNGLPDAKV